MSYSHARINLEKTKYKKIKSYEILLNPDPNQLRERYYKYCNHHKFNSVMPLFDIEFEENTIIGYYDGDVLVAFSMICEFDNENAEAYQFAWDYANPKLHLGIKSLRNECAIYKELGKLEDSENCYRKAIELNPNYIEAYNNLGITLRELGNLNESSNIYKKIINLTNTAESDK